ncbi:rhomboid family intramembrane serine protease [Massilia niabensis]|uniref:Rhomboid family intramembrane serine protease n=1 Tax=Massilia niabensis TaxID=544910 RepID=A0ABW0L6V8_9BURK
MRPKPTASAILALACLALACLPETVSASLAWEREAILTGQGWRLWTGHLVHFGLPHALTDALVLLAAGAILEGRIGPARLLGHLALAAPFISLLLLAAMPGLAEYRGASSLAALLAVAAGVAAWPQAGRGQRAILAGAAAFAAACILHALGAGIGLSSLPQGVAVAWQAHPLGAACGLHAGLSARAAISASHT